jgi:drug/metabolite transporter (DMT)-like permease
MKTSPSKSTIAIAITSGILAVSTASIFIRVAQGYAPSLVIAALRLTFASLIIAPIALSKHRVELASLKKRDLLLGLVAGIFLALHFATWITSLEYTTVASSVVLVTTTPLWVALLSPLVLKEPITRPVIWGMLLALLGGLVIGFSDACRWENGLICPSTEEFFQGQAFWGDFLALVGAWMAAGYLLIGRRLRSKISLIPYIFVVYGMAAIILLVIMFSSGESALHLPPQAYFWILLLAIFPQLIGHSTFNWALKYLPASLVSITLLGEPIGSTILAFIILDEVPSTFELMGAALILIGIYLASRQVDAIVQPDAANTS